MGTTKKVKVIREVKMVILNLWLYITAMWNIYHIMIIPDNSGQSICSSSWSSTIP